MKLLIQQKVFSFRDRFSVYDENGDDRYLVQGELFSWGKKLHVTDRDGRELASVEQQLFTFRPRYAVYAGGALLCEVVKELSLFRPRYTVEGIDWEVEGDFWSHEYTVSSRGRPVVSIWKEWFTWGIATSWTSATPPTRSGHWRWCWPSTALWSRIIIKEYILWNRF